MTLDDMIKAHDALMDARTRKDVADLVGVVQEAARIRGAPITQEKALEWLMGTEAPPRMEYTEWVKLQTQRRGIGYQTRFTLLRDRIWKGLPIA